MLDESDREEAMIDAELAKEATATPGTVIAAAPDASHFRHDLFAGRHSLVADEPASAGGDDSGPNPFQLLQGALAACTSMTMGLYARRKGIELGQTIVRVSIRRSTATPGLLEFDRLIELDPAIPPELAAKLLEIAEKCPIHRALSGEIEIKTSLGRPEI